MYTPQGYSKAGQEGNVRDAIQWGADYLIKAHVAPGSFVSQIGNGVIDGAKKGREQHGPTTFSRVSLLVHGALLHLPLAANAGKALSVLHRRQQELRSCLCSGLR